MLYKVKVSIIEGKLERLECCFHSQQERGTGETFNLSWPQSSLALFLGRRRVSEQLIAFAIMPRRAPKPNFIAILGPIFN